jgi:hypothetical protein
MSSVSSAATAYEDYFIAEEDHMDIVLAAKDDFERKIMPKTRKAISEMIAEAEPEFVRTCRTEYLKECMSHLFVDAFILMDRYEEAVRKDQAPFNRLWLGVKIWENVREIVKLQGQIIALRHPGRKGAITDEIIQQAKEHPFTELLEFRHNTTSCPFHGDKTPSMHFYEKDNRVHCFSCHRSFDTIGFVMERDGYSFIEAVKFLT